MVHYHRQIEITQSHRLAGNQPMVDKGKLNQRHKFHRHHMVVLGHLTGDKISDPTRRMCEPSYQMKRLILPRCHFH